MPVPIGPYEVLEEIGRGAMGRVLKVRHRTTGIVRALKLIADASAESTGVARFKREAELLARVGGASVVTVHETGHQGETLWYAMDYCERGSLGALLEKQQKLPWAEATRIVAKVARAIAACHQAGVIHRDVKPENILLDDQGEPRLSDFGCARDLVGDKLTKTGATVGTAFYMPIEQLRGAPADAACDVYGLGVLLYELVTGSLPFDAEGWVELAQKVERNDWTRVHALDPTVPALLDGILGRALARDRRQRPTAAVFAAELEDLVHHFARAERPAAEARRTALARAAVPALLAVPLLAGALVLGLRGRSTHAAPKVVGVEGATPATRSLVAPAPRRREPLAWRFAKGEVRHPTIAHRSRSKWSETTTDVDRRYGFAWRVLEAAARSVTLEATIERFSFRRTTTFEGDVPTNMLDMKDPVDYDSTRERDASSPFHAAVGRRFFFVLDPGTGAVTSISGVHEVQAAISQAVGSHGTNRYRVWDLATSHAFKDSLLEPLLHVLPDDGEIPGWAWELNRPSTAASFTGRERPALRAPAEVQEAGETVTVAWSGSTKAGDKARSLEGTATFGPRGLLRAKQHEELSAPDYEHVTDLELVDAGR